MRYSITSHLSIFHHPATQNARGDGFRQCLLTGWLLAVGQRQQTRVSAFPPPLLRALRFSMTLRRIPTNSSTPAALASCWLLCAKFSRCWLIAEQNIQGNTGKKPVVAFPSSSTHSSTSQTYTHHWQLSAGWSETGGGLRRCKAGALRVGLLASIHHRFGPFSCRPHSAIHFLSLSPDPTPAPTSAGKAAVAILGFCNRRTGR
jgi:hypothetical protein